MEEVLVDRRLNFVAWQPQITAAFCDLDEVNLTTIFECRGQVMKTVPSGGHRSSLWEEVISGSGRDDIPSNNALKQLRRRRPLSNVLCGREQGVNVWPTFSKHSQTWTPM